MASLAVHGGSPTIAAPPIEQWQRISQDERNAVLKVLDAGTLSVWDGDVWDEFCNRVSSMSGDRYVLPTPNGTTALLLAAMAANIRPGDEVMLPAYAYFAVANPVLLLGATPVFCDIDCHTLNIDPIDLEKRLTRRCRAIIVTHSWGNPAPLTALRQLCESSGLTLISDASHAQGALLADQPLGRNADMTCYSFGPGKAASAGELGAVTTANPELFERLLLCGGVRLLPNHLHTRFENALPLKSRPHALALAIGAVQLRRLEDRIQKSRAFAAIVEDGLAHLECLRIQKEEKKAERVYHRIVFTFDGSPELLRHLSDALIAENVPLIDEEYCTPLHKRRAISHRDFLHARFTPGMPTAWNLPVTERVVDHTLAVRPYISPSPCDLAELVVAAFRKVWLYYVGK